VLVPHQRSGRLAPSGRSMKDHMHTESGDGASCGHWLAAAVEPPRSWPALAKAGRRIDLRRWEHLRPWAPREHAKAMEAAKKGPPRDRRTMVWTS